MSGRVASVCAYHHSLSLFCVTARALASLINTTPSSDTSVRSLTPRFVTGGGWPRVRESLAVATSNSSRLLVHARATRAAAAPTAASRAATSQGFAAYASVTFESDWYRDSDAVRNMHRSVQASRPKAEATAGSAQVLDALPWREHPEASEFAGCVHDEQSRLPNVSAGR